MTLLDPELLLDADVAVDPSIHRTAEAVVAGKTVGLEGLTAAPCRHAAAVFVKSTVAIIHETEDPATPVVKWQLRVDLQCGECGQAFTVDPAGSSRDDGRGAVFTIQPQPTEGAPT